MNHSVGLRAYPDYNSSGVVWLGALPQHWRASPLKTISSHNDDVLSETTSPDAEIAYVDISGVDAVNGIKTKETMLFSAAPSRARRRVKHGDVVVSTVRTYLKAIARIRDPEDNLIVSTGFAVIRPNRCMAPDYLGYLVASSYFLEQVIARSAGVSYPAINASELVAITVPVPPTTEQIQIAAFLNRETGKIDVLVAEQRRLIELLREKRQAVISHAVTKGLNPDVPVKPSGVEWLGEVPVHWDVMKVKHLARSIEQGWSPQCLAYPTESDGEWGVLKVGCVNGGIFDPTENKSLPPELDPIPALAINTGDLLISRANTRELVGGAAVARKDYRTLMLCDKLYRLRFAGTCDPDFAALYFGSSGVRGQIELSATGASASMVNIPQSAILELNIAVPPIFEQRAIVATIERTESDLRGLSSAAQSAIDLLHERRSALISAAVTGQIDVRGLVEPAAA